MKKPFYRQFKCIDYQCVAPEKINEPYRLYLNDRLTLIQFWYHGQILVFIALLKFPSIPKLVIIVVILF